MVAFLADGRLPSEPAFSRDQQFPARQVEGRGHVLQALQTQRALVVLHIAEHLPRDAGEFGELLEGEVEAFAAAADDAGQSPADQAAERPRQRDGIFHRHKNPFA